MGDVNHDGYPDILIGAPYADPNGLIDAGEAYLVFGGRDILGTPSVFNLSSINGKNGVRFQGIAAGDQTGYSVSSAGDVNSDGIPDILIGANKANPQGRSDAGEVYLIFGGSRLSSNAMFNMSQLNGSNGIRFQGMTAGDNLGYSVSSAGFVNGDGKADIIFSAPYAAPQRRRQAGEIYLLFGGTLGSAAIFDLTTLNASNGVILEGITAYSKIGTCLSSAQDVNHDGYDDILIGSTFEHSTEVPGEAYLVFGGPSLKTNKFFDLTEINGNNGVRIQGGGNGYSIDGVGISVSDAGDVNGDNYPDILLGAYDHEGSGTNNANIFLIFGAINKVTFSATPSLKPITHSTSPTTMPSHSSTPIVVSPTLTSWHPKISLSATHHPLPSHRATTSPLIPTRQPIPPTHQSNKTKFIIIGGSVAAGIVCCALLWCYRRKPIIAPQPQLSNNANTPLIEVFDNNDDRQLEASSFPPPTINYHRASLQTRHQIHSAQPLHPIITTHILKTINSHNLVIIDLLGEGSYGEVFYGTWQNTTVAIKKFLFSKLNSRDHKDFDREITLMQRVKDSPYVVQYLDHVEKPRFHLVMEIMMLGSLYDFIAEKKDKNEHLSWQIQLTLMLDISHALVDLHNQECIHSDIKSPNILLTGDKNNPRAKIGDFGHAYTLTRASSLSSSSTIRPRTRGTIQWNAPEVCQSGENSTQSDIFAVGMVFWEIITLQVPFKNCNPTLLQRINC